MSDDLVAFIEARLAEDEQLADLISSGGYQPQHWRLNDDDRSIPHLAVEIDGERLIEVRALDGVIGGELDEDSGVVAYVRDGRNEHLHIVRHDPARVLRGVDRDRRLLAWCRSLDPPYGLGGIIAGEARRVLRLLALPYADHADFRPEWSPTDAA